jgi:EAL domain-containing protein (putative c-di-GMP-specific phosphodiesterase class I)
MAPDDFGSEQSSLGCVHQLALDKIKIDRGVIRKRAFHRSSGRRNVTTLSPIISPN